MAVQAIPKGYHSVTPLISVKGAARLIDFLKATFGAEELSRIPAPDGTIMHAEVKIGDSIVMLGEEMEGSPSTPAALYIYVPDSDVTYGAGDGCGSRIPGRSFGPVLGGQDGFDQGLRRQQVVDCDTPRGCERGRTQEADRIHGRLTSILFPSPAIGRGGAASPPNIHTKALPASMGGSMVHESFLMTFHYSLTGLWRIRYDAAPILITNHPIRSVSPGSCNPS